MIQALQKRFIRTAMLSLALLLSILIVGVVSIMYLIIEMNSDELLDLLSSTDHAMPIPQNSELPFDDRTEQSQYAAFQNNWMQGFFIVYMNSSGKVESIDSTFSPTFDRNSIADYADKAWNDENESGRIDGLKYRITDLGQGDHKLVFVDLSSQFYMLARTFGTACAVALVCLILMFIILLLMSKRAVKPIADNIEKQRRFVTDAGHEIRTPLAIISANNEALEMNYEKNKWSKNIQEQVNRLDGLMQQLLTLSRMDESSDTKQFQKIDLSELIAASVETFAEIAEKKSVTFALDTFHSTIIKGDPYGMQQLVSILIDNAIKYSDPNASIHINLEYNEKKVVLEMANVCSSLSQSDPEAFFDRFYRGDAARTQRNGGYGIGLSVALAIAELHQGSIRASIKNAKLICFTLEFPSA